jgi:hypothetical protein
LGAAEIEEIAWEFVVGENERACGSNVELDKDGCGMAISFGMGDPAR